MIHLAETLAIGSIEDFLTPAEATALRDIMDAFLADQRPAGFGTRRTTSIHEIPGHTAVQAMAVYEPAGRIEITGIPGAAEQILSDAFARALPAINRGMPSISRCRPWTYVEYGPGQHITPHLDGIAPDPLSWPRQIAGISIVITEAAAGGGFFVETTSDQQLWERSCEQDGYSPGMHLARDGADQSADWFQAMTRTRWQVTAAAGTALLYGSQLTHGTEPVREGRARKFISWLTAQAPQGA
ncbi:hypothetical protein [Actinomadura rupiterrae]|uniref:hypothetical protein n=1 Tax=Actinomadura rupiterrae TaxID=559627 RepID=UPI0020A38747|nr:hypothetical protein [Actinomadura rupiterrae]MCP2337540.1 hypothetical protein [Actinomadura rupiterrae]